MLHNPIAGLELVITGNSEVRPLVRAIEQRMSSENDEEAKREVSVPLTESTKEATTAEPASETAPTTPTPPAADGTAEESSSSSNDAAIVEEGGVPLSDVSSENDGSLKKNWRGLINVILLGLTFFFLFLAYNTSQNFATELKGTLGYVAVGFVYLFFAFGSVLAPWIISWLGLKLSLIIGDLAYIPFIISSGFDSAAFSLIAAAVLGVGAGMLWAAHGVTLTSCSETKATLGLFSGIFLGLYQINQLFGNLSAALFMGKIGQKLLFIIFGIIATSSVVMLVPMRIKPQPKSTQTLKQRLFSVFIFLKNKKMLYLVVPFIFGSTEQTWIFGKFPPLAGKKYLGFVMAAVGTIEALASPLVGKISDRFGKKPFIVFVSLLVIAGSIITYIAYCDSPEPNTEMSTLSIILLFCVAPIYALTDAIIQVMMFSLMGSLFSPEESAAAFGCQRFVSAAVTGLEFIAGAYITVLPFLILFVVLSGFYVLVLLLLDKYVTPIDTNRKVHVQSAVSLAEHDADSVHPLTAEQH